MITQVKQPVHNIFPFHQFAKHGVTVHSHVNHSADWHGGCTFCPECISPIAVDDSKWRDTLLFTAILGTVTFFSPFSSLLCISPPFVTFFCYFNLQKNGPPISYEIKKENPSQIFLQKAFSLFTDILFT